MTVEQFFNLLQRFAASHSGLMELAAHIGIISLNGYSHRARTSSALSVKSSETQGVEFIRIGLVGVG